MAFGGGIHVLWTLFLVVLLVLPEAESLSETGLYCPACTAWDRNSLRNRPFLPCLYCMRQKLTQKQAFTALLVLHEAETHSETGLYCPACTAWGWKPLRNRPVLPCLYAWGKNSLRNRPLLPQKQACIVYCPACTAWGRNSLRNFYALLVLPEAETHSETGRYCLLMLPEAETYSETGLYCTACIAWGRNLLRNRPLLPCLYCLRQKLTQKHVSYWRKYVHEVLVNRLGGVSLPRKSVVRLTDNNATMQCTQKQAYITLLVLLEAETFFCNLDSMVENPEIQNCNPWHII